MAPSGKSLIKSTAGAMSLFWPAVSISLFGLPWASTIAWILLSARLVKLRDNVHL